MAKRNEVFEALSSKIRELGSKDSLGNYVFSELSLNEEEGGVIGFSFIGGDFAVTSTGVFSIDESKGDVDAVALSDELEAAVLSYLTWRTGFASRFEI